MFLGNQIFVRSVDRYIMNDQIFDFSDILPESGHLPKIDIELMEMEYDLKKEGWIYCPIVFDSEFISKEEMTL